MPLPEHAGETLGIVGESGSGKSTIAKTLMLLQPSSGGEALFRGKNIAAFTAAERRQYRRDVQMVFQDAVGSLNPRMTIRQALNEILGKSLGGVRGRQSPRPLSTSSRPTSSQRASTRRADGSIPSWCWVRASSTGRPTAT